eukprot:scaffold24662_cov55-Phaeocystis_antarctica.AAC.2
MRAVNTGTSTINPISSNPSSLFSTAAQARSSESSAVPPQWLPILLASSVDPQWLPPSPLPPPACDVDVDANACSCPASMVSVTKAPDAKRLPAQCCFISAGAGANPTECPDVDACCKADGAQPSLGAHDSASAQLTTVSDRRRLYSCAGNGRVSTPWGFGTTCSSYGKSRFNVDTSFDQCFDYCDSKVPGGLIMYKPSPRECRCCDLGSYNRSATIYSDAAIYRWSCTAPLPPPPSPPPSPSPPPPSPPPPSPLPPSPSPPPPSPSPPSPSPPPPSPSPPPPSPSPPSPSPPPPSPSPPSPSPPPSAPPKICDNTCLSPFGDDGK